MQIRLEPSAYRHEFNDDDVAAVLENYRVVLKDGDTRLLIGKSQGILLEVVGDYETDENGTLCFRCYHCMECQPRYAKFLDKRG